MTSLAAYDAGILNEIIAGLPDEEQHQAVLTLGHLVFLHRYSQEFSAAKELIDVASHLPVSDPRRRFWSEIAARDAVMTIYHFGNLLTAISTGSGKLDSLKEQINFPRLREAKKSFKNQFKGAVSMRDATAHRADNIRRLETIRSHRQPDGLMRTGYLEDRTYHITHEGTTFGLTIDAVNHNALIEIVATVFDAYPFLNGKLPPLHIVR